MMMIRDKKIYFKKADERLMFNNSDRAIIDVSNVSKVTIEGSRIIYQIG